MYNQLSASNKIGNMIKEKDYDSAIQTIRQEIIEAFVKRIKENNINYKFSNVLSLINTAENQLSKKEYTLLKKYYYLITEENCAEYELYELMNIYSNLKEVRKNDI